MRLSLHGPGFDVRPVTVVSHGASNGPRIATATFERRHWLSKPRFEVWIAAEVDGARYQDESGVRRRAGRAAVPVGRRAADQIANSRLEPETVLTGQEQPWVRATWRHVEAFDGFSRVVTASADYLVIDEGALNPPEGLNERIVRELRALSDSLHVSIDDPAFRYLFGGR